MSTHNRQGKGPSKRNHKRRDTRKTRQERIAMFWEAISRPGGIHIRF